MTAEKAQIDSSYIGELLTPSGLKRTRARVCKLCREIGLDKFDAIAFRGLSGALIAPLVCTTLDKYPLAVRKQDGSHSSTRVEGIRGFGSSVFGESTRGIDGYIILDDFIDTGKTLREIADAVIERHAKWKPPKLVAVVLWTPARSMIWSMRPGLTEKRMSTSSKGAPDPLRGEVPVYSLDGRRAS